MKPVLFQSGLSMPPARSARAGWRRGFSLIEVTLTLGIVGLGTSVIFGVLSFANRLGSSGEEDFRGAELAQRVQAELTLPGSFLPADGAPPQTDTSQPPETGLLAKCLPLARSIGTEEKPIGIGVDLQGQPVDQLSESEWVNGTRRGGITTLIGLRTSTSKANGSVQVLMTVEVPARAARENRRRYEYWFQLNPSN